MDAKRHIAHQRLDRKETVACLQPLRTVDIHWYSRQRQSGNTIARTGDLYYCIGKSNSKNSKLMIENQIVKKIKLTVTAALLPAAVTHPPNTQQIVPYP